MGWRALDLQLLLFKGTFGREGEQTAPRLPRLTEMGFCLGESGLFSEAQAAQQPVSSMVTERQRSSAPFTRSLPSASSTRLFQWRKGSETERRTLSGL